MNAEALLKSQGWRGKGYSLHPTDNSIGLSRPLLISRTTDGRGVGSKASYHATSDQWWLRAFDEKLKGLDTSAAKNGGGVVQTVKTGKLDAVTSTVGGKAGKYTGAAGLYACFVRGGVLEGTLGLIEDKKDGSTAGESTDATPSTSSSSSENGDQSSSGKKRKKEDRRSETREERLARKAAKRIRKEEKAKRKAAEAEAKRKAEEKAAKKALKKARRANETKEERRARKAERRARKEAKRLKRLAEERKKAEQG
ncbi:hypothetical protein VTJ04DRAFT_1500 [Mycothermus thermophilus]|uniref:uncharacterized protein n=1 Tax=Humicola insolens TaxID=85995 RepID=UPI003743CF52